MRLIRSDELTWEDVPGLEGRNAAMAEVTGEADRISTGFVRMEGVRITRQLAYDELIHVISGRMQVTVDGRVEVAGPGDCVLLPRGVTPTVVWDEPTEMFFAIAPANWRTLVQAPLETG